MTYICIFYLINLLFIRPVKEKSQVAKKAIGMKTNKLFFVLNMAVIIL